ncbi:MAG: 3-hydroxybutyryl-CoA dehydrogenase [Pikeienuella sp.]
MSIQSVGVIGAGQMGLGIAHVFALAGYHVRLNDIAPEKAREALTLIKASMNRQIKRGVVTEAERDVALAKIELVDDLPSVGNSDLIIEAVTESEKLKREVFETLTPHLKPTTILTSTTSSVSITRLAATTDRPDRFMGFHFMNPVPMMKLVELIRGLATSQTTIDEVRSVSDRLGKASVMAEDFPAFIVNRILFPMMNEAANVLLEGVGTVESIDASLRLGANHPMGPLQLADFIGLDICLHIMNTLNEELSDTKYRPSPLLVKYVEAGWLGRKTGRGFYDYSGETPTPTR